MSADEDDAVAADDSKASCRNCGAMTSKMTGRAAPNDAKLEAGEEEAVLLDDDIKVVVKDEVLMAAAAALLWTVAGD